LRTRGETRKYAIQTKQKEGRLSFNTRNVGRVKVRRDALQRRALVERSRTLMGQENLSNESIKKIPCQGGLGGDCKEDFSAIVHREKNRNEMIGLWVGGKSYFTFGQVRPRQKRKTSNTKIRGKGGKSSPCGGLKKLPLFVYARGGKRLDIAWEEKKKKDAAT